MIHEQEVKTKSAAADGSRGRLWASRIMYGAVVLFMLFDGIGKLAKPQQVIEGTLELGYEERHLVVMGVLCIISTILYALPRTRFLGALLLTGYLGGAVATHVRVDNPLWTHTLFPFYLAILAWGPLWLMDPKIRKLFWKRS